MTPSHKFPMPTVSLDLTSSDLLEFRRHGARLLGAAHVSPQRTPPLSGLSLARVVHLRLPLGHRYSPRSDSSPLIGRRSGLPCACLPEPCPGSGEVSQVAVEPLCPCRCHVPRRSRPSSPSRTVECCLRRQVNVSATATLSFSRLAHTGPRTPCLRIKMAVTRHPARLGSARRLPIRRLGVAPTGFARRVSERPGRLPSPRHCISWSLPPASAHPLDCRRLPPARHREPGFGADGRVGGRSSDPHRENARMAKQTGIS